MFLIVPPITIQLIEYLDLEPFIVTGCFLKPSQELDAGILYLIVGSASVEPSNICTFSTQKIRTFSSVSKSRFVCSVNYSYMYHYILQVFTFSPTIPKNGINHAVIDPTVGPRITPYNKSVGIVTVDACLKLAVKYP